MRAACCMGRGQVASVGRPAHAAMAQLWRNTLAHARAHVQVQGPEEGIALLYRSSRLTPTATKAVRLGDVVEPGRTGERGFLARGLTSRVLMLGAVCTRACACVRACLC